MSFNHFKSTASSRNPLTMTGIEQPNQRPISRAGTVRSAQTTPNLLQWSPTTITPSQSRSINHENVTRSSHNLLSHQEFQAKNKIQDQVHFQSDHCNQQSITRLGSASTVMDQTPKFQNLTGDKPGKTHVQTTGYRSMKNDANERNVAVWSTDEYSSKIFQSKYSKLEDNFVSKKNTEAGKRKDVLHSTEGRYHQAAGAKSSNGLYQKHFKSSALIGGNGEVASPSLKTMSELNKSLEKLSTMRPSTAVPCSREKDDMKSSSVCRKMSTKPKWR